MRHAVQTYVLRGEVPTRMRSRWRLASQRRRVFRWEWLIWFPVVVLFPQISQARAMAFPPLRCGLGRRTGLHSTMGSPRTKVPGQGQAGVAPLRERDRKRPDDAEVAHHGARNGVVDPVIAVYPGSFDPPTYGHLDLIERASQLFQQLYVGVLINPSKEPLFSPEERVALLHQCTRHLPGVRCEEFRGLVVEYARSRQARVIVRGLRAVSDFEYEFKATSANRKLAPEVETVFMMTAQEYAFLSSTIVKEVARFGGDVSEWVPPPVEQALRARLGQRS